MHAGIGAFSACPIARHSFRPRFLDVILEQALEVGKAGEAEDLREAHQGGGLHPGLVGDLNDGAKRNIARVLPEEDGDLAQPLREMHGARRQDRPQFLVGLRLGVSQRGKRARLLAGRGVGPGSAALGGRLASHAHANGAGDPPVAC